MNADGAGCIARTRRSSSTAGRAQSRRACVALDARRERDAGGGLRRRRGACPPRRPSIASPIASAPSAARRVGERPRGVVGARSASSRTSSMSPASISSLIAMMRDAGLGVARQDGVRDRRGAAMPRQERRVHVDAAVRRQVEHRARQDAPVGGDDDQVGRERARDSSRTLGVAHPLGLQHGQRRAPARASSPAAARSRARARADGRAGRRRRRPDRGAASSASRIGHANARRPHEEDAPGRRGAQKRDAASARAARTVRRSALTLAACAAARW